MSVGRFDAVVRFRKPFRLPLPVLEGVGREGDGPEADECEGKDDEPAEGLHFRKSDDEDELEAVHGRVESVLDPVQDSAPVFFNALLKDLSDCLQGDATSTDGIYSKQELFE